MTAPKLTPKGKATRQHLLSVAGEELAKRGTLEIAGVAGAASLAASALYRYFDGRDGLIATVVEHFYDEYEASVFGRADIPGKTWAKREELRLRREIGFFYGHPLGQAVASGLLREPAAARVDAERTRTYAQAAGRNIRVGQRAGELAAGVDADLAGAAIMGAARAALAEALSREEPPPEDEVAAMVLRIGIVLLSPGGSHRSLPLADPATAGPRIETDGTPRTQPSR